jgi:hypothetical protein
MEAYQPPTSPSPLSTCVESCSAPSAADPVPPEPPPILLYTLTTASEITTGPVTSFGLLGAALIDLIGAGYAKSHEKFLRELRSIASDGSQQSSLLQPLACVSIAPEGTCRRIVEAKEGVAKNKLVPLLQAEPSRSARIAEMHIVFDGRLFQIPTKLYEVHLNDKNEVMTGHQIIANYLTSYSRKQHQEDIDAHKSSFAGSLGSKDAEMDYWFGGDNPRLITDLERGIDQISKVWAATLIPEATGIFAGDDSVRRSLPQVIDVVGHDPACHTMHPKFRVARDAGDYLWLVFTSNIGDSNEFLESLAADRPTLLHCAVLSFVRSPANTSMCWRSPRCCSPCVGVRRHAAHPYARPASVSEARSAN